MRVYLLVLLVAAAVTYMTVPIVRHVALVSNALTPVRARDVHSTPIPVSYTHLTLPTTPYV